MFSIKFYLILSSGDSTATERVRSDPAAAGLDRALFTLTHHPAQFSPVQCSSELSGYFTIFNIITIKSIIIITFIVVIKSLEESQNN